MKNFICYTGIDLDRASSQRKNPLWIKKLMDQGDSLFIPIWNNLNLVCGSKGPESELSQYTNKPYAAILSQKLVLGLIHQADEIIFLGIKEEVALFAVDFSSMDQAIITSELGVGDFFDLRKVGGQLKTSEAALLSYAKALTFWHRENQFCSRCGNPSTAREGGHVRFCENKNCLCPSFPRVDPAVIMLVERTSFKKDMRYCLLGRQKIWPEGMYSTLAGFVEPGESLEEAVSREVKEESGIEIENIRYKYSQPWPFPASIMLGYWASAKTTSINMDENELDDVKWFSEKEMSTFGEWGEKNVRWRFPRRDSIARYLIDSWLNEPEPENLNHSS